VPAGGGGASGGGAAEVFDAEVVLVVGTSAVVMSSDVVDGSGSAASMSSAQHANVATGYHALGVRGRRHRVTPGMGGSSPTECLCDVAIINLSGGGHMNTRTIASSLWSLSSS
jgi:hypothetical protein